MTMRKTSNHFKMIGNAFSHGQCCSFKSQFQIFDKFQPAKAFDGDKIDATKNRHILRAMFQGVPWIAELVKYFEEKYNHLEVRSVWMIEKSKENDGFQGWHRDFYLGTEVTMTIVVNVGALKHGLRFNQACDTSC